MLVCASFSDHCLHSRGSFEAFRRTGSEHRWLYTHRGGKWSEYYGPAASETRRQFFDHFLKGLDNGWDRRPVVRLAIHDQGPAPAVVLAEDAWPPEDLTWQPLWLDAGGSAMVSESPPQTPATRAFEARHDALAFSWTVPEDLDTLGPMALRLWLEIRGRWPFATAPFTGGFPARYQAGPDVTCVVHTGGARQAHLLLGHRRPAAGPS